MKRLAAFDDANAGAPADSQTFGRFDLAWGGIASLSTALPVLWTNCAERGITLPQLAQWTSAAPAALAGLSSQVGSIEVGKHANFVAFDPEATFTVTPDVLHYRYPISPYMHTVLRGAVRSTWLRGTKIFDNQTFPTPAAGREYALVGGVSR